MSYTKIHQRNIKAYNKMADCYDASFDGKFTRKFKDALVRAVRLPENSRVLDVACGNATLLAMLAEKEKIQGYGVDISDQMIVQAQGRHVEMEFHVASCEKLPFADETMDIVTVCASYHHFPDVNAFAAEAKRILRPRGHIYIAEIYLPAFVRKIANFFMSLFQLGNVKFYSPEEISVTFTKEGFTPEHNTIQGRIQILSFGAPTAAKVAL